MTPTLASKLTDATSSSAYLTQETKDMIRAMIEHADPDVEGIDLIANIIDAVNDRIELKADAFDGITKTGKWSFERALSTLHPDVPWVRKMFASGATTINSMIRNDGRKGVEFGCVFQLNRESPVKIWINPTIKPSEQLSTCSHELGHLQLQHNLYGVPDQLWIADMLEAEAHMVAALFSRLHGGLENEEAESLFHSFHYFASALEGFTSSGGDKDKLPIKPISTLKDVARAIYDAGLEVTA